MTETSDHPDSLLKSHAAALRRLAEHLLDDPHEVDDALQDCWAQVLASPPKHDSSVRAWLETVLRNVVRKRARSRQRVKHREQQSAQPERLAPTLDLVARRQTLAALTTAIHCLDQDLQEVVFLRYFDELPPRAIATQVGRPVEQIYKDLERARHKLRRSLEDEHKDWRATLMGLWGLSPSSAAAGWLLTGSLIMLIQHKILLGLGSALAIFLAVALYYGDETPETSPKSVHVKSPDNSLQSVAMDASANPSETREEITATRAVVRSLSPYEYELEILAIDEDDLPARKTDVLLGPYGHDLNRVTTDDRGIAHIRWRGRTSAFELVYGAVSRVVGKEAIQRTMISAQSPTRLVVRVKRKHRIHATGTFQVFRVGNIESSPSNAWLEASAGRFPAMVRGDDNWFEFVSRCEGDSDIKHATLASASTEVSFVSSLTLKGTSVTLGSFNPKRLSETRTAAGFGSLFGTVLTADGKPAKQALLHLERETEAGFKTYQSHCDDKGGYSLDDLPPGDYTARAGGGQLGIAQWQFTVSADSKTEWRAQLDRGLELKMQLVGNKQEPLSGWRIEILAFGIPDWIDGTTTDKDGRFQIPNLEHRAHRIRCYPPKTAVPFRHSDLVWPSGEERILQIPEASLLRGDCQIKPSATGVAQWNFGPAQLWRDDDFGVMRFADKDKTIQMGSLPAGAWQVLLAGRGLGFDEASTLHLLPGSQNEHQIIRDRPTKLRIPQAIALGKGLVEVYFLHKDVVSHAGGFSQDVRSLWLRPGSYILKHEGSSWPIEVKPGEQTLSWPE